MKIYTRGGDTGETSLFGGERVRKSAPRVSAYGEVDELNSVVGVARAEISHGDLRAKLETIQSSLFDLGGELATPGAARAKAGPRVAEADVAELEGWIDALETELEPLRNFILPGGSRAASHLHLARTVCRRAERIMVELADQPGEMVSAPSLKYVNRLSDYLFVAGRYANDKGARDVLWAPGQNR